MGKIAGSIPRGLPNLGADAEIFRVEPGAGALQAAIDASVADRGDLIIVEPGSHSVTETVTVNKAGVTIMAAEYGGNPNALGEKFTVNAASTYTNGPAVTITQPCSIIGMGIAGRQTAGESLLIDCEATGGFNGGFVHLLNCRFSCWYGAMTYLVRSLGGQLTRIEECTFDGLFGGVGTAGVALDSDTGPIDPGFLQLVGNYFYGMGSGKHAVAHVSGDTPVSVLYQGNRLMAGFGAQGKFLDNNSCDSTGLIAGNWLAPLANQAAAFENMTNSSIGFADNHYEEA